MMIAGTLGCTIDAPADAAYAVLPVGVDIINPRSNHASPLTTTTTAMCFRK